jgi:hypothetical protein
VDSLVLSFSALLDSVFAASLVLDFSLLGESLTLLPETIMG